MYQYSTVYQSNTDHDYVSIIHKLNTLFFDLFFSVNIFWLSIQLPSCFLPFSSLCVSVCYFVLEKNSMIICSFKKLKFIYFTTIDKKQLIFIFFVGKDVSSRGSLVQWILDILDTIIRILDSKIIIDFWKCLYQNCFISKFWNFDIRKWPLFVSSRDGIFNIKKSKYHSMISKKWFFFVFCLFLISENTSKILKRHPLHVYLPNLDK